MCAQVASLEGKHAGLRVPALVRLSANHQVTSRRLFACTGYPLLHTTRTRRKTAAAAAPAASAAAGSCPPVNVKSEDSDSEGEGGSDGALRTQSGRFYAGPEPSPALSHNGNAPAGAPLPDAAPAVSTDLAAIIAAEAPTQVDLARACEVIAACQRGPFPVARPVAEYLSDLAKSKDPTVEVWFGL